MKLVTGHVLTNVAPGNATIAEAWLEEEGIARSRLEAIEEEIRAEIEAAVEEALVSRTERMPDGAACEFPGFSAGVRQPGLAARLRS